MSGFPSASRGTEPDGGFALMLPPSRRTWGVDEGACAWSDTVSSTAAAIPQAVTRVRTADLLSQADLKVGLHVLS
jgi:hypothetical protein